MSLRAALNREVTDPRRRCGVHDWIITLPADEQEAAHTLLASDRRTTHVWDDFRSEGLTLQYNAVLRHRLGRCSC